MKRLNYLPIAVLAIAPVTAFAHKVPYGASHCAASEEQAAFEEIPLCTEEEKEKSSAIAYCTFMGHPALSNCVEGIVSHGMAEAAGKCADKSLQMQTDIRDEMIGHKVGGSSPSASDGYWHLEYRYSKEDGWHRHDWGATARDKAGREYGITAVRQAKEASAVNKKTDGKSKITGVGGVFRAAIGLGPAGGVDHEVNANHTTENNSEVESGPLTQEQMDKAYDEGYSIGYTNPNLTTVSPDVLCERDKPKCGSSFSRDIINEDYHQSNSGTAGTDNKANGSSGKPSGSTGGTQGGSKNPTTPPSKSTTEVDVDIDQGTTGTFAGDPTPVTKPGEMIASFDNDDLVNSPISRCLMEEIKEQVSKDMNKTYDPNSPGLTAAQRKKEAQGLLRKGICDAKFYGQLYCQKHKMMKLTTTKAQDMPEEDKTDLFNKLQELGKYNFGNPADYEDRTPIDFNRIPKTDPNTPAFKPIAIPGRG